MNVIWIILSLIHILHNKEIVISFENDLSSNRMFVYPIIEEKRRKLLIDTGSYLSWYKDESTQIINCNTNTECKGKINKMNSHYLKKENNLIVEYESGFIVLNFINCDIRVNNVLIRTKIGKAKFIDINTYYKFDGIFGLGIDNLNDNYLFNYFISQGITMFSFDFKDNTIRFSDNNDIRQYNRIEVDSIGKFWEVEANHFTINHYDLCDVIKRYYSKCMILFDTGTQTNSLPSERILSLFNKHINNNNKLLIDFSSKIKITVNNKDIIRKISILKSTSLFQSNSLGKIVLGINFIRAHNMIFNISDRYILIESEYNKVNYSEISTLITKWKLYNL